MKKLEKEKKMAEIQAAVAMTMTMMGISSGELTFAQAKRTYGAWFIQAVERGWITPCRYGEHGRTWYSVPEILAFKAAQLEEAEVKIKN